MGNADTLIACFSRSGENYRVGTIEKGNGMIIAEEAARLLGAPVYGIATVEGYPEDYEECNRAARKEREENARPALRFPLPDMAGISRLVLIYPNWWGDLPMAVYTMLDSISTKGLCIYPICTHEWNGLGMTDRMLGQAYPEASVMKGLAIRGTVVQDSRQEMAEALHRYLAESGFSLD